MSMFTDNMEKSTDEDEVENQIDKLDFHRPSIFLVDYRYGIN